MFGGGVLSGSPHPDPILYQNMPFSTLVFKPALQRPSRFQTWRLRVIYEPLTLPV